MAPPYVSRRRAWPPLFRQWRGERATPRPGVASRARRHPPTGHKNRSPHPADAQVGRSLVPRKWTDLGRRPRTLHSQLRADLRLPIALLADRPGVRKGPFPRSPGRDRAPGPDGA
jgi:hypothetical protein